MIAVVLVVSTSVLYYLARRSRQARHSKPADAVPTTTTQLDQRHLPIVQPPDANDHGIFQAPGAPCPIQSHTPPPPRVLAMDGTQVCEESISKDNTAPSTPTYHPAKQQGVRAIWQRTIAAFGFIAEPMQSRVTHRRSGQCVEEGQRSLQLMPVQRRLPTDAVNHILNARTVRIHANTVAHKCHHNKSYHCWSSYPLGLDDKIILLLGVTGAGKTTLLLALADTLHGGDYDRPSLIFNPCLPDQTPMFDEELLVDGAPCLHGENGDQQRSQTVWPVLYFLGLHSDGHRMWALDTPGFLDLEDLDALNAASSPTHGHCADKVNEEAVRVTRLGAAADAIADLPHFTSVVAVYPGNTAGRKLPEQDAVLRHFSQMVPDNAKSNAAMLVLTRSVCCGDAAADLPQIISEQTRLVFGAGRVFRLNNMRFSGYCATAAGLTDPITKMYYTMAKKQAKDLLKALTTMPNIGSDTFKTLAYYRKAISAAVEELVVSIRNKVDLDDELDKLQQTVKNEKDRVRELQNKTVWALEEVETPGKWHTVCQLHGSKTAWNPSKPNQLPPACHKNCNCMFSPSLNSDFFGKHCDAFTKPISDLMPYDDYIKSWPGFEHHLTDSEGVKYDKEEAAKLKWRKIERLPLCGATACSAGCCPSEMHMHICTEYKVVKKRLPAVDEVLRQAEDAVTTGLHKMAKEKDLRDRCDEFINAATAKFEAVADKCRRANRSLSLANELAGHVNLLVTKSDRASVAALAALRRVIHKVDQKQPRTESSVAVRNPYQLQPPGSHKGYWRTSVTEVRR